MAFADKLTGDVRLTNLAVSLYDPNSLVRRVFPNTMNVDSINTWFPTFDEKAYIMIDDRGKYKKGFKSKPREVDFEYTKNELMIKGYEMASFKSQLEINELSSMQITDAAQDMTKGITTKLNQFADLDLIDNIIDTTAWANGAVSAVWTDQTNGDPEKDLRAMRGSIQDISNGFYTPNTIFASRYVLDLLFMHAKIKSRYDNVSGSMDDKKKWLFDMIGIPAERVFEVTTVTNTAKKGATKSNSAYMGAYLWMGYIDPNPSRTRPTAICPLVPQGYVGNEYGILINKIEKLNGAKFEDGRSGIKVFGDMFTEVKQISAPLGRILTGIYT